MNGPGAAARVRGLRSLLAAQVAVVMLAMAVAAVAGGGTAAMAAGLGGCAYLIPHAWFAWRVLGADPNDPDAILRALYRGEAIKLGATVLAFAAIFTWWPQVPPLPLMLTFIAVQLVHWLTPVLLEQ